jgi:hypothetical protein
MPESKSFAANGLNRSVKESWKIVGDQIAISLVIVIEGRFWVGLSDFWWQNHAFYVVLGKLGNLDGTAHEGQT